MPNVIVVAPAGATFGTGVATTTGSAFAAGVGLSWAWAARSAITAWASLAACIALLPSMMSLIAWSSGSYASRAFVPDLAGAGRASAASTIALVSSSMRDQ